MRGYDEDLAYVHDAGFGAVAEAGVAVLVELLHRRHITRGLVVELGCGSGMSSRLLTEAGYDVLGIDSSPAMVELARRHAPSAEFRVGSFVDVELPACEAVTALGEVLSYTFDERSSRRRLGVLSDRVHAALRPGGAFVLDMAGPGRRAARGWAAGADWAVLSEAHEDESGVLTRRITTFREVAGTYRRREEVHRLRLYPASAIAELLRRAGFRVRVRRRYGQQELPPNVSAFLATKPAS